MKKFLIKGFLFVSIFLFISNILALPSYSSEIIQEADSANFSVFKKDFKKVLLKANIDVFDKHFSGLIFIKYITKDSTMRIVFLSEVGLKIFDLGFYLYQNNFSKENFTIHYCLGQLNKKALIKTIKNDFDLILMNNLIVSKLKRLEDKKKDFFLWKYKNKNQKNLYFQNIETGNISKIISKKGLFRKVSIELLHYKEGFPEKIFIAHRNMKLNIELIKVKNPE